MTARLRFRPLVARALCAGVLVASASLAWADGPTLEQRLDRVRTRLEQARVDNHVPGCAIAIVRGDKVILARGFGLADRDSARPADADTRFAIGSTTKAFTATLIAELVDQGKMSFDEPVSTHLPDFHLADPDADAKVTIRDLLCHRVGLASLNVLWYGTSASQEDILAAVSRAKLLHSFRQHFGYSNISFLAAGLAAANAAGVDSWQTLLRKGLLTPLGMDGVTCTYEAATADPAMATGYSWDDDKQSWKALPMRSVDAVAPAGAINASANEMAQWLRFQLAHGAIGDDRLLSEGTFLETWKPQIEMQPGVQYALGWMISDWQGHRVVHHAGGIDGFTAQVAILPDDDLAYVLLMNLSGAALSETSRELVFDAMVSDWSPDAPAPAEDFSRLTGTYIGDFGQFKGAEFKVLVQNGRLAIDVPGQTTYELLPPGEDGKRAFALTDQIKIKFNENDKHDVYSLTLYQAGYRFELPRKGVEQPSKPVDLAAVRPDLGKFHFDALGVDVEVLIHDDRLALDVPGQTTYDLLPPDDEGRWVFRIKDSIWVKFNKEKETGAVNSITLTQDGADSVLPRVAPAPEPDLPTVEALLGEIRKARGGAAIDAVHSIREIGDVKMVNAGIEGSVTILATDDGNFRSDTDLSPFGKILVVASPDRVWVDAPFASEHEQEPEAAQAVRRESPMYWLGDWRKRGEVTVERRTKFDDRDVYEVRIKTPQSDVVTWYVDADSKLPVVRKSVVRNPMGVSFASTTTFDDFRPVEGVLFPFSVTTKNGFTGSVEIRYSSIDANPQYAANALAVPGR